MDLPGNEPTSPKTQALLDEPVIRISIKECADVIFDEKTSDNRERWSRSTTKS